MSKVNIAGVLVDDLAKQQVLEKISGMIETNQRGYIVTPYSEQVVFANRNHEYAKVLNSAAISIPDGIGILWASKYLSLPGIYWNFFKTLFSIILKPGYIRSVIPEQVTGREIIFDIAKLAETKNLSLAMVGGSGNVSQKAAEKLKQIFPKLKINLTSSPQNFNDETADMIAKSNSDILFMAYSPPKQEIWIAENFSKLNVKIAMGLGGTFDYLAGKRPVAPKFIHYMGLEWFWRLITQPWRIKRIWNAVPVFSFLVLKHKSVKSKKQ